MYPGQNNNPSYLHRHSALSRASSRQTGGNELLLVHPAAHCHQHEPERVQDFLMRKATYHRITGSARPVRPIAIPCRSMQIRLSRHYGEHTCSVYATAKLGKRWRFYGTRRAIAVKSSLSGRNQERYDFF